MSRSDPAPRILLVDDEPNLVASLRYNLRQSGFRIHACASAEEGLDHLRQTAVDLVLLDVMLPGMDGFEACREIRANSSVPVVMLTARDDEIDRVVGLEIGADDYVTKPFSVRELQARIKALLRRHALLLGELESRRSDSPLVDGDLVLDRAGMRLEIGGETVELRPKEFDLLEHLLANRGRVISSEDLIRQVWGHDFTEDTRTVRVHISLLRHKIEPDPTNPRRIQTVRGSGYRYARP
ncbi:MAG: response regulator transcription factor [Chloroflexi bacterium]|nr:response regulator transcription factor [Chloroflexota bacterium]MXX99888.1 response regulator transcription factor [Chloroflexota bacterium]